jgi:hypothetical protein
MNEKFYYCPGCGRIEHKADRELYKGFKYVDMLNFQAYCINCSSYFSDMEKLPDSVVEQNEALTE